MCLACECCHCLNVKLCPQGLYVEGLDPSAAMNKVETWSGHSHWPGQKNNGFKQVAFMMSVLKDAQKTGLPWGLEMAPGPQPLTICEGLGP